MSVTSINIRKKSDTRQVRAWTHKLADIPGGIGLYVADFGGAIIREGTPVGKDSNGLYHAIKSAKVYADATDSATTVKVAKGHGFKANEFIALAVGSTSKKINSIDTSNAEYDTLTLAATLGAALTAGDVLPQAAAAGASAALPYAPVAMLGESYDVVQGENLWANAVTIGQVKESNIPPIAADIKAKLTGVIFI